MSNYWTTLVKQLESQLAVAQARIKELEPVIRVCEERIGLDDSFVGYFEYGPPNIKLTFEDGKLVKEEALE